MNDPETLRDRVAPANFSNERDLARIADDVGQPDAGVGCMQGKGEVENG